MAFYRRVNWTALTNATYNQQLHTDNDVMCDFINFLYGNAPGKANVHNNLNSLQYLGNAPLNQ